MPGARGCGAAMCGTMHEADIWVGGEGVEIGEWAAGVVGAVVAVCPFARPPARLIGWLAVWLAAVDVCLPD